MRSHAHIPGNAKHAQVARALLAGIDRGTYPLDSLLPSESELATAFGVSRQTIRAALRTLRELGIVEGHQGVGSFVRATRPSTRYAYSFDTPNGLQQYATTTQVRVLGHREIVVQGALAKRLERREGERWWEISTLRTASDGAPVAASRILIPYAFAPLLDTLHATREPLFALIQSEMGHPITEIWQNIMATSISTADAALLNVPENSPGLQIERRYFGRNGELLEVSESVHPANTFNYAMRMRLTAADSA